MASVYNLPGVSKPKPLPFMAAAQQSKAQPQQTTYIPPEKRMSVATTSKSHSHRSSTESTQTTTEPTPTSISAAETPGGLVTQEAKTPLIPAVASRVGSFVNRVINPQSDSRTLGQAWSDIFEPFSRPGVYSTPNLNPQWRGTQIQKGYEPAGYRSTAGMSPGEVRLTQYYATGSFDTPGSQAVQSVRQFTSSTAKMATETALLSVVAEVPAITRGARLANLERQEFQVIGVKTAFSARESEQGFVPGVLAVAKRSTASASETRVIELKLFQTGEGRAGYGLSSFRSEVTMDNLLLPGSKTTSTTYKFGGGSESLGLQPKLTSVIINEDIGKVTGSLSQGFVYGKDKTMSFASVGATRKEAEGVFSFVTTKGDLKLKAYTKESTLVALDFDIGKATFIQPLYYRGKIGARGVIFDRAFPGTTTKELTFDFAKTGRPFRTTTQFETVTEQKQIMQVIQKPMTTQEAKTASSGLGMALQDLRVTKQGSSIWEGTGLYERTAGDFKFPKGSLQLTQSISVKTEPFTIKPLSITSYSQTGLTENALIMPSIPNIADIQNQAIGSVPIQSTPSSFRIDQQLKQNYINPTPSVPSAFPDFIPSDLIFGGFIPTLSLDMGGLLSPRRTGKQKKRRTPSLYAAMFGITSTGVSALELTGLTSRPILTERRKRKK